MLDACLDEISNDKATGLGAVPCYLSIAILSLMLLEKAEKHGKKKKISTKRSVGHFKGILQPLGSDIWVFILFIVHILYVTSYVLEK